MRNPAQVSVGVTTCYASTELNLDMFDFVGGRGIILVGKQLLASSSPATPDAVARLTNILTTLDQRGYPLIQGQKVNAQFLGCRTDELH